MSMGGVFMAFQVQKRQPIEGLPLDCSVGKR